MSERVTEAWLKEYESMGALSTDEGRIVDELRRAWAELDQIDGSRCLTDAIAKAKREGAIEELERIASNMERDPPPNELASLPVVVASVSRTLRARIAQLKETPAHGN